MPKKSGGWRHAIRSHLNSYENTTLASVYAWAWYRYIAMTRRTSNEHELTANDIQQTLSIIGIIGIHAEN